MELVAMDMKLRGDYIALQLSFKGVTFKIEDVGLTVEFVTMYNKSVDLVSLIIYIMKFKFINNVNINYF